jgi:AcrR family transcriptional regulator
MTPSPRLGRPRSPAADQAIVDAALVLFAEEGFEGFTMEGVATRAGVGKATVYRRYPGKVELVMRAAECLTADELPAPDTGTLRGDLVAVARSLVHLLTSTPTGGCVTQLVAALPRSPELADEHARFVAARRERTRGAVARAARRGEVSPDTDAELVADLVAGPIFYRYLVSRGPLDDGYADSVVDAVLASLDVRAGAATANAAPA